MSPRRRIPAGEPPLFAEQPVPVRPPRQWRLPLLFILAALMTCTALTVCTLVLVSRESHRRAALKDVAALSEVRSFMTLFTSPDPFHANDYVKDVLARGTGEFAKRYEEKANETLLRVAQSERTSGTVLDAGVERWNDDGSVNVLVATEISSKSPDGKQSAEVAYRWVVTAEQEGDQWKISSLVQVV